MKNLNLYVDLYDLISSIALAVDLAECSISSEKRLVENITNLNYGKHRFINHSKRTGYVAVKIAQQISNEECFREDVYISSVLHDIGVSENMEDAHNDFGFIAQHSIKGNNLMKKLPFGSRISEIVKYHHENYDGSGYFSLKSDEIPLISQIIRISDIFELLYDETKPNYVQREQIIKWITNEKNHIFSPFIADIFMDIQKKEKFWLDIENLPYMPEIMAGIKPDKKVDISLGDLKNIAVIFADFIDTKSPFTFQHSSNLSILAEKVSDYLGFDSIKSTRYQIAALLHDIGKLAVPNSILDKPDRLTQEEYTIIKAHTYYTRLVLSRINNFKDITDWGANHHEKLNGRGYPLSLSEENLSTEERCMAVCDIFEALTANRPYRKGLSKDEAFKIINNCVESGEICGNAAGILREVI